MAAGEDDQASTLFQTQGRQALLHGRADGFAHHRRLPRIVVFKEEDRALESQWAGRDDETAHRSEGVHVGRADDRKLGVEEAIAQGRDIFELQIQLRRQLVPNNHIGEGHDRGEPRGSLLAQQDDPLPGLAIDLAEARQQAQSVDRIADGIGLDEQEVLLALAGDLGQFLYELHDIRCWEPAAEITNWIGLHRLPAPNRDALG